MSFKSIVAKLFTDRPIKGFTVAEAFDRLDVTQPASRNFTYETVRGRVYDLVREGQLVRTGTFRIAEGGRKAEVFTVPRYSANVFRNVSRN